MITKVPVAIVALLCIFGVAPEMAESQDPTPSIPAEVQTLKREGYGAVSKGGDGGRVVWVTNLKDFGPGSLREALAIEEARIVKFKVGGVIELEKPVVVKSGRVTIDGLSAAAKGGITVQGGFHIRGCEDVIVRHIRSRGGYDTLLILQSPSRADRPRLHGLGAG